VSAEWESVVAAAKQEGKVVVAGPPGAAYRAVQQDFQARYPEIQLEFAGSSGRDLGPRVLTERQGGQKLWDVQLGGTGTMYLVLKPGGALANIRPALLPEVTDDDNWHGGFDFGFTDNEKLYAYAFAANANPPVHVNRSSIPAAELSSPRQLVEPRFKGRIVMEDPRTQGARLSQLTDLMVAYGEDFIRKLLAEQDVILTRDIRQLTEWVVRGRYPVAIGGVTEATLAEFRAHGLGQDIDHVSAPEVERWTPSFGGVGLFEGAPHPNAARVYVNWLLSRGTQELWARTTGENSRRTDVAPANLMTFPRLEKLTQYIRNDEAYEESGQKDKARRLAESLIQ